MKICIIIPVFNEEKNIIGLLKDLAKVNLPIIFIDDGSKDNSVLILEKFRQRKKCLILKHKINLGKGAALKTGCDTAVKIGAEAMIIMDSDGQHKVEDLDKFIEKLSTNKFDIIFGSRNLNLGMPLIRFIGNKLASVLISLLFKIYISDLICGYRAFTKKAYEKIRWESTGYGVETEMIINTGLSHLKHCEVSVETVYYDKFKGVTILDAISILGNVLKWRMNSFPALKSRISSSFLKKINK